jgi:sigma-B regulation protein RsbU (phosphoserine phosphatase)
MYTILCVDDEQDMEMLITQKFRRQIRNKEYEFVFAHDGLEALSKLAQYNTIKLILSDINMPQMDGLTFLSKLKENKLSSHKTIMISAYGDIQNIRTAMNMGAFDFLTKPIVFEDLEITIKKTLDEIEVLDKFQRDRDKLVSIDKDLTIAKEIQQSMLPKKENPFPDRLEFELHGLVEPAKSVGGDLFDYFLIDHNRLCFIIADVSDKGVPAALIMAITITLFKTHFKNNPAADLAEQMRRINNILSDDNPMLMFVTAFACILTLDTGDVEYVDCGHEQPLVVRDATGEIEIIKKKPGGLPLCLQPDFPYHSSTFSLNAGDTLILYTDGLEDAQNSEGKRFTIQPSTALIKSSLLKLSPVKINTALLNQVKAYIDQANQFDDITILTVKYNGKVS